MHTVLATTFIPLGTLTVVCTYSKAGFIWDI